MSSLLFHCSLKPPTWLHRALAQDVIQSCSFMGDSATKIAGVLVCSGAGSGSADVIFLHLELMTPLNR